MTASVTIPYNEFQAIQDEKRKALQELAQLKETIRQNQITASDQTLLDISRAAIEIVRFAVASLPPESTHGWPTAALQRIAAQLPSMPDTTTDDQELAITLMTFARECERFEDRRQALKYVGRPG